MNQYCVIGYKRLIYFSLVLFKFKMHINKIVSKFDVFYTNAVVIFYLGFECRCGGLFCGIHRYSDKHNCSFDYRELGAQEIRRNNPVVVGEKIQKI